MDNFVFEYNIPGSSLSSMKVGGPISRVCRPQTAEEFCTVVSALEQNGDKYLVLGNGSNVIFSDKGFGGTVVLTTGLTGINDTEKGFYAAAGVSLSAIAAHAADRGLSGLEFAFGIPGTVGGGIYMNAGAYGGEIKDVLSSVHCADKQGNTHVLATDEADLAYRHSAFKQNGLYILGGSFVLAPGDKEAIKAKMAENMGKRRDKQPLEYPSCGSTFKRPVGHYAGALIEQSGLKGAAVGGAQVSEKHAGFVINRGGATGDEVIALIKKVRDTVLEKTGVTLETEVEIY